jgi:hypothetical protein
MKDHAIVAARIHKLIQVVPAITWERARAPHAED